MKTNFTICFLILLALPVRAQVFQWLATPEVTFPFNVGRVGYTSAADADGNTYVCGYKDNPLLYNDVFGNLSLSKYTPNGQLLFTKAINGSVSVFDLHVDVAGNLYVVAAYRNEISVGDLHLTTTLQGVKPILLKFDSNGELLWNKSITQDSVSHFKTVATDPGQNVYIGYDDYGDSYIEKLDADGNSLSLITQSGVKMISDLAIDTEGNIYGAGSCAEMNVSFNGTAFVNLLQYNTYIVKYNAAGQFQWKQFVEDITCTEPKIAVRTPNEVYFSSELFGPYTFGSLTAEGPSGTGSDDFFLARLNSSGDFQWVREIPGVGEVQLGNRNFLTLDESGNIYLATKSRFNIQWNASVTSQTTGFSSDILILRYSPQGEVQWAKMAGGSSEDRADSITALPDGGLLITGVIHGSASFDGLTNGPATAAYHPYVAKLALAVLDNTDVLPLSPLSVYPNPTKNNITIHAADYRGHAHLYSVLGQELKTITITANETSVDISELANGTYFLKLDNQKTSKLVKY